MKVIDQELLAIRWRQESRHWPHESDTQSMTHQLLTCRSLCSEPGACALLMRALLLNRTLSTERYAKILMQTMHVTHAAASSSYAQVQDLSAPSDVGGGAAAPRGIDVVSTVLLPSMRLKAKLSLAHRMIYIADVPRVVYPYRTAPHPSGDSQSQAPTEEHRPAISARTLATLLQSAAGRTCADSSARKAGNSTPPIESRFFDQPVFDSPLFLEAACWLTIGCSEPVVDSSGDCMHFLRRQLLSRPTPLQLAALQPVLRAAQTGSLLWHCDSELVARVCAAHGSWYTEAASGEARGETNACVELPMLVLRYCRHLETSILELLPDKPAKQAPVSDGGSQPPQNRIWRGASDVRERFLDWENYCDRWHALLNAFDGKMRVALITERARYVANLTSQQRAWIQRAVALTTCTSRLQPDSVAPKQPVGNPRSGSGLYN